MQRAPRGTQTKERLLETASRLMSEQGYTATRVEQICTEAGVTKGAFFHYFKTKDDLGQQTVKHWQNKVREEFLDDGAWKNESDPMLKLFGHLSHVQNRLATRASNQGCLYCVCAMESGNRPEMAELVRDALDEWRDEIATMIEAAANGRTMPKSAVEMANGFLVALEGSHILAKAFDDVDTRLKGMDHFRTYLALALGLAQPPV